MEEIKNIILESIWISRWNESQTSLTAVLTEEEAEDIYKKIIDNLEEYGYKIVKK